MRNLLASLLWLAACGGDASMHSPDAGAADAPADVAADAAACTTQPATVHHAGGTITAAETWAADTIHIVDGDILVEAPVTIERCATIEMTAGTSLELRPNGSLENPDPDSQIKFQPLTTAWSRIRINGGSYLLASSTITGAGLQAPGALTLEAGTLTFQELDIDGSTGLGLLVTGGTVAPASSSSRLLIGHSGSAPLQIPANQVGSLPHRLGLYDNAPDEIRVPTGTTISTSQIWFDHGVPYHLTGGGYVKVAGTTDVAVLTLAGHTRLRFDKGAGMLIEPAVGKTTAASGALHADGHGPGSRIFLTSAQPSPAPGDWQGLFFGGVLDPHTELRGVTIAYAGGSGGGELASCPTPTDPGFADDAAIRFLDGPMPAQSFISDTTIEHSPQNGIDRSFALTVNQVPNDVPDFTATNTFTDVAGCNQTHTRAYGNGCPATPTCN